MVIDFNRLGGSAPASGRSVKSGESGVAHAREPLDATSREVSDAANGDGSVNLSPVARQLQSVSGQLSQTSEVDTDRVANIRQALAENRYPIDTQRLAGKLLDFESHH